MSNRTMAATPSPTGLYWSERGEIACALHTPYEGTDTWNWERWAPLPVAAIAVADHPLRCETCGKEPESRGRGGPIRLDSPHPHLTDRMNPRSILDRLPRPESREEKNGQA